MVFGGTLLPCTAAIVLGVGSRAIFGGSEFGGGDRPATWR